MKRRLISVIITMMVIELFLTLVGVVGGMIYGGWWVVNHFSAL